MYNYVFQILIINDYNLFIYIIIFLNDNHFKYMISISIPLYIYLYIFEFINYLFVLFLIGSYKYKEIFQNKGNNCKAASLCLIFRSMCMKRKLCLVASPYLVFRSMCMKRKL
jgi:hypothetical protein